MNIAVVDVAAQTGGALSVLNDFVQSIYDEHMNDENEWYIFTSVVDIPKSEHIHNIKIPYVKKSWLHRLFWEYFIFKKNISTLNIDLIVSLQNNALPVRNCQQFVYLHNVLLLQKYNEFSFLKKTERKYALTTNILAPYIRYTWRNADMIFVQGESVKKSLKRFFPESKIRISVPTVKVDSCIINTHLNGFIYPASPESYKNHKLIIESLKRLNDVDNRFDIIFTFDGDENEYARVVKSAASDNGCVKFIGKQTRDNILNYYKTYGLIITSDFESFGMPIAEAMAVQTVIVALKKDYVYDHINSTNYNRIYLSNDDPYSLKNAMQIAMLDVKKGNYQGGNRGVTESVFSEIRSLEQ